MRSDILTIQKVVDRKLQLAEWLLLDHMAEQVFTEGVIISFRPKELIKVQ